MAGEFRQRRHLRWERVRVRKAQQGDRRAFEQLYRKFAPVLYGRVLLPLLADEAAAEDVLADTFRIAFTRVADFQERGVSIWFWLQRIARNRAMDLHRSEARKRKGLVNVEQLVQPLLSEEMGPEAIAQWKQDQRRMQKAVAETMAEINPRYAQALQMRFFQERSRDQCAAQLDVTVATLDVIMLRALRSFRKKWQARMDQKQRRNDG